MNLPTRIFITLGILIYAGVNAIWMLPNMPLRNRLNEPLKPGLLWSGLWQNFAVFSPDPRLNNMYVSAVVTFADGSMQYYELPRNDKLPVWQRPQQERYRKYGLDNLYYDSSRMLWADAARFVARRFRTRAPVYVSLQRHWQDIPPPELGLNKPLPEAFHNRTFFIYPVTAEDLK